MFYERKQKIRNSLQRCFDYPAECFDNLVSETFIYSFYLLSVYKSGHLITYVNYFTEVKIFAVKLYF